MNSFVIVGETFTFASLLLKTDVSESWKTLIFIFFLFFPREVDAYLFRFPVEVRRDNNNKIPSFSFSVPSWILLPLRSPPPRSAVKLSDGGGARLPRNF